MLFHFCVNRVKLMGGVHVTCNLTRSLTRSEISTGPTQDTRHCCLAGSVEDATCKSVPCGPIGDTRFASLLASLTRESRYEFVSFPSEHSNTAAAVFFCRSRGDVETHRTSAHDEGAASYTADKLWMAFRVYIHTYDACIRWFSPPTTRSSSNNNSSRGT